MTIRIDNKIGLEAEYLLRNKKNEIVFPGDYAFSSDDFIILGEIRAKPGNNIAETISNFIRELILVKEHAIKENLTVDISKGYEIISPDLYATIMKRIDSKEIAKCSNVYKTDILKLSDAVVENGELKGHKISIGLHVHFSSHLFISRTTTKFITINLKKNLYMQNGIEETGQNVANLITDQDMVNMVKKLDKNILPKYRLDTILKYRNPGFFEKKSHGFEYRSLPFNQNVLDNLEEIVRYSFSLVNSLNKKLSLY